MDKNSKPLEGIKVLDFTRVLAGPYCTMLLSDLGAEIIKVESPTSGDDSRDFGPFKDGKSLYFISINRGKKSISLNLKKEKAKKIVFDLVKKVDVVIENFRPGTMNKFGLSYEKLSEINPGLIYASASGFGHSGPDSSKPAYDMLVQSLGGLMSITGWENTPPTRVGMSIGDIGASLFTAIGITSALYQRELTGKGKRIDVAMLDCQVAMLENAMLRYQVNGISPTPIGNRHPTITPFQCFKAKDDYITIPIGNNKLWIAFCEAIERTDLTYDEKFENNQKRTENIKILIPIIEDIIKTKTVSDWCEIFEKFNIPHSPINKISDVMKSKQVLARNMIVDVDDKDIGIVKLAGNPIKMSDCEDENYRNEAPEIGQHNKEILSYLLGLSESELKSLKDEGVI